MCEMAQIRGEELHLVVKERVSAFPVKDAVVQQYLYCLCQVMMNLYLAGLLHTFLPEEVRGCCLLNVPS